MFLKDMVKEELVKKYPSPKDPMSPEDFTLIICVDLIEMDLLFDTSSIKTYEDFLAHAEAYLPEFKDYAPWELPVYRGTHYRGDGSEYIAIPLANGSIPIIPIEKYILPAVPKKKRTIKEKFWRWLLWATPLG
ncbi:hypothetical protein LZ24_03310 [Desulfobotulus alkaliphilus]|uniref:Uncharacterized protein n=1 Tax=Desulfobotulus alkaliphilus TaxID=622671 RepID=A0A562R452_9BACT|nr:hypothetical protein [Desulfobotulus alkaliphilus]TWI63146.1 hypothetical protein LZ24_03310 [Desulfobotulus alkaliphilus]